MIAYYVEEYKVHAIINKDDRVLASIQVLLLIFIFLPSFSFFFFIIFIIIIILSSKTSAIEVKTGSNSLIYF